MKKRANERTFQGELFRILNSIISLNENIHFSKVTQEENVGLNKNRFADGILYSSHDKSKQVYFELKNSHWDATNEILVKDAMLKAFDNGIEYFVTGTPRQLVIFKTFEPGTTIADRKLKIYYLSNIQQDDEVLLDGYEQKVNPTLKQFLFDLSDLVHNIREIRWESIDGYFVNKLSAFILEASANMTEELKNKLNSNQDYRSKLIAFLEQQEIFEIELNFEREDIYKIAQLINYLFYLKVIFYTYLQRDLPELNLKTLIIPEDISLLNRALRERFDDVITKHDFELIFQESILDEIAINNNYLETIKRNIEEISHLDFKDLDADIIGAIYNTLIDNREQHDRGQHFTNTNEVDIVCNFCIDEKSQFILDSGCGAGTFLVGAYKILKKNSQFSHEQILEKIWGVEIALFPAFLSVMNLSLLNIKVIDNYPIIINKDFAKIRNDSTHRGIVLNKSKQLTVKKLDGRIASVKLPEFDVCIGNPPYTRHEMMENKKKWIELSKRHYIGGNLDAKCDLYVYYLIHTSSFLKEGGKLGYVIASSWLDTNFGTSLQKFLLENFKIICIIENQAIRSFSTASINTVILILEKCSVNEQREENIVRFVKITKSYDELFNSSNRNDYSKFVSKFVLQILSGESSSNIEMVNVNQKWLEEKSTIAGKYENGFWGANFLRAPEIFKKIIKDHQKNFVNTDTVVEVRYGIKSGANDFFYLVDETQKLEILNDSEFLLTTGQPIEKRNSLLKKYGWYYSKLTNQHHLIEREYCKPLFKSSKEAHNLQISKKKLKYYVLICNESKVFLKKKGERVLDYILLGESPKYQINERSSVQGRKFWYSINLTQAPDFIFQSKIGDKYSTIDNRTSRVFNDKVLYCITVHQKWKKYSNLIFGIFNSIMYRFFIELFARQMTGHQTISDVDVSIVRRTIFPNPVLFDKRLEEFDDLFKVIAARPSNNIQVEISDSKRIQFEKFIGSIVGLSDAEVLELLSNAKKYVNDRNEKSKSIVQTKVKTKHSLSDIVKKIKLRFEEINEYSELLKECNEKENIQIPDGSVDGFYDEKNLFGEYVIDFKVENGIEQLRFNSLVKFNLVRFLIERLLVKNETVFIPSIDEETKDVLRVLTSDYEDFYEKIAGFVKTSGVKYNTQTIYRRVVYDY